MKSYMKKLMISTAMAAICSVAAVAQTNFRAISYADAIQAAKAEGKMVFIDFYTDWCGPCKMMARDVFPQKKLGDYMNSHFVSIKVNAEKGEGTSLAKRFDIHAYPTFVIVNSEDKEVNRTSGSREAESFISELERMVNPEKSPLAIRERYQAGDRSAQTVKDYAALLKDEAMRDRKNGEAKLNDVARLVREYFDSLSEGQKLSDDNLFIYTEYTQMPDEPAALFMKKNLKHFGEAARQEIEQAIAKTCEYALFSYFTGYKPVDAAAFKLLGNDIKTFKLNADGKYDAVLSFINSYIKDDKDQYVDFCRNHFNELKEEHRTYIMSTYSRLFADAGQDVKLKAARFVRDNLSELPFNAIYAAALEIGRLEGKAK
ncbi:MAG: thioredoxin family protein [Prevotella sp.]|nr:thioredoxin family protein [Prevotella sp.]